MCPLNRRLGRPWNRSGGFGLEYNNLLLTRIEQRSLGRPPRSLVPILTELHRFPLMTVNNWGILKQKSCKLKYSIFALYFVVLFDSSFVPRGTAATPKQGSWNRSAWRYNRIRGEHCKLTDAVGQNLCIAADWAIAYHSHAHLITSTKCALIPIVSCRVNTRDFSLNYA
jgi:hypothetical protein